jgi:hypothetical protein
MTKPIGQSDKGRLQAFMSDYKSMTYPPYMQNMRVWVDGPNDPDAPHVMTTLKPFDGYISFHSIMSPDEQGKGLASSVIKKITKLADKNGVSITLEARPFTTIDNRLKESDLIRWYKRHGWVRRPGYMDPTAMIRYPGGGSAPRTANPSAPSVALRYAAARVASGVYFHGTSEEVARKIMQQGFSLRSVGQRQRAVHGDDTLDPKGVFVTSDLMQARWYAGPDPKRPGLNRGGAVVEVKVSGRMMSESDWWKSKRRISEEMGITGLYDPRRGEVVLRAQEEAKKQGYAGFHEDGDEYIVFDPKDVKPVRAFHAGSGEPLSKTAARPIRLPTREIKTLAKKLAQRLYQYGLPKPGRVTAQEYLPLTNVMGDEVVVEILLTGTPGRNRDPFSNELLNGGFLKRRPEGPVMRVFVNPHLDPRTFEMRPRRIVEKELYRLLAHELTHAADVWSGKGSVGDLSGSKDDLKKHHHNHPAEVRALMRDVVTHLDDGDHVRDLMGYGMDFNTALREALKDTKWPDIEPYLTPRNKKTILKGVYTFLQDQGLTKAASRTAGGFRKIIDEIEDETGLEAKVEASDWNIKIELKRGMKLVGYFRASTVDPKSFEWDNAPTDCKEAWGQMGEPPVWVVRGAEWFDRSLRGKGFGKLLYKALFSYIASEKGVVGPDLCSGGNTSPDAQRVWKSLRSMYPRATGPLIDLRKMASASRVVSRYVAAKYASRIATSTRYFPYGDLPVGGRHGEMRTMWAVVEVPR